MAKDVKIDDKWGLLIMDGNYYEHEGKKGKDGNMYLKRVSKAFVEKKEKRAKKMVGLLKDALDKEKVLMES